MTKKGFTLMELLVSIFISGMVMLGLVALWKSSASQTAEAQRQSIIKNENTIFLRKIYADFISASEIICPWGHSDMVALCPPSTYIAVKEAVVRPDGDLQRITAKKDGEWSDTNLDGMVNRNIKPSYVAYIYGNNTVYRCENTFLEDDEATITKSNLINTVRTYCSSADNRETIMPYVENFSMQLEHGSNNIYSDVLYPELLIDYTVKREFSNDLPPIYFRFKRYLTIKRGV